MTKEEAIKKLRDLRASDERILIQIPRSEAMKNEIEALDMAIKALEQPTMDKAMIHTLAKENDELKAEIGRLRQALEHQPSEDCVSRTQAIEWIENLRQMDKCFGNYEDDYFPLSEVIDRLKNVPPVTPTHGTCKDCHNAVKNYGNGRIYCLFSNCIYDEDFWCKKFEKRGSENEIN